MSVGADQIRELNAQTDAFFDGRKAYEKGIVEAECPYGSGDALKRSWIGGHRSAKRDAERPCLPLDEYLRIQEEAEEAYKAGVANGERPVNPYAEDTEAGDIWNARLLLCSHYYGDTDDHFVVLGRPVPVTAISEYDDGSVLYSIPTHNAAN